MRLNQHHLDSRAALLRGNRASVLIIVLWVAFGLCSIALYFAHSMSMELKAADNTVANMEADQAIEGAAVYVSNLLVTLQVSNNLPSPVYYHAEAVKVGDAQFWLVGRDTNDLQISGQGDQPIWGLVDEASKVNLNNATADMLLNLPQMTQNMAAAIFDWQSTNLTPSTGGAKSDTYSALPTPYVCKSAPFESIAELNMVYGLNMDYLYGEDANLNGILDPNENDGLSSPPYDNKDGILDPGLLEYTTVFTRGESTVTSNGITRIAINNTTAVQQFVQSNFPSLYPQVQTALGAVSSGRGMRVSPVTPGGRVAPPSAASSVPSGGYTSVLQFYFASGLSEADFQQIEPYLMNPSTKGLINVNTATATGLACIPGIGVTMAPQVLSYRQSNPPMTPSISWLKTALNGNQTIAAQAGPYVTAYSYQYSADVVAVGHHGRGYRRVRFVFDCSSGTPLVVFRQDLTHLGWALGKKLHDKLLADNSK